MSDSTTLTEHVANKTMIATPEGYIFAYLNLVVMALLAISLGAFRSINSDRTKTEILTLKYVATFPIVASCLLLALYLCGKGGFADPQITDCIIVIPCMQALTDAMTPLASKLLPSRLVPSTPYHFIFPYENLINFKFNAHDVIVLAFSLLVGFWYFVQKHWVASNLLGLALAVNAVELLHLDRVTTGVVFLTELLFYDIFWVFCTDVMESVARSIDAPIKLVFPVDFLENGFQASKMSMLGLGDVAIPGLYIALLLRYDRSLGRKSNLYFWTSLLSYIAGLIAAFVVMHLYNQSQPALLYLVPACLGPPTLMALVKGDLRSMLGFVEEPEENEEMNGDESKGDVKKVD